MKWKATTIGPFGKVFFQVKGSREMNDGILNGFFFVNFAKELFRYYLSY